MEGNGQEIQLGQLGALKEEIAPQPEPQQLPEPAFTNEQFVNLLAPIVYDAAAGDLPPEMLAHMPSPAILKAILDLIGFEKASGLLNSAVNLDPKKTLMIGLGATAAWSAWVVVKATAIKNQLKKSGQYQSALERAAEAKKQAYQQLKEELERGGDQGGAPEGN